MLINFNSEIKNIDTIFVKLEYQNQAGSIKDRPAFFIIKFAKERGYFEIVEATSGNMGISLSFYGAMMGVKVTIFMPKSFSVERQKLLKLYGANLILVDGNMGDALKQAKEYAEKKSLYFTNQFDNRLNAYSHEQTTAIEILNQVENIDYFVASVGSGGTLMGVAKVLKPKNIKIVAVESENSPIIYNKVYNKNLPIKKHKIQGIGAGFIPKNIDLNLIDEVVLINDEKAIQFCKELPTKHQISAGISTGANILASQQFCGNVVTVAPDSIERYLSVF